MELNRTNKKKIFIIGLCCLVGAGLFLLKFYDSKPTWQANTIHIKYSFALQNNTANAYRNAGLLASTPLSNATLHNCLETETNHPFKEVRDAAGNIYHEYQWDLMAPFTTKMINIKSKIEVRKAPQRTGTVTSESYIESEPYIESNHELIKEMALRLMVKKKKETIRNIFNWVSENLQYSGYVKKNRGALYALKHRKGDCTEFATLFVALCRASGIPARYMGGFVAPKSAVLDLGDYHNWAEFHYDDRWHIADPQHKTFMDDAKAAAYIAFKIIQPSHGDNGALVTRINGDGLKIITGR